VLRGSPQAKCNIQRPHKYAPRFFRGLVVVVGWLLAKIYSFARVHKARLSYIFKNPHLHSFSAYLAQGAMLQNAHQRRKNVQKSAIFALCQKNDFCKRYAQFFFGFCAYFCGGCKCSTVDK
jgi:hypothetical protein